MRQTELASKRIGLKKAFLTIFFVTVFCWVAMPALAEVTFIIDLKPASYLFSPKVSDFKVGKTGSYYSYTEEIQGYGSWIPTLKAGVGIGTSVANIDLTGGVGYLWNMAFNASMFIGDAAVRFKLGEHFTLGPHVGVIHFIPSWSGEGDVDLSSTTGFAGGVSFTAGGKIASFSMTLDYLNASFDVTTRNGWVASDNKLDISGVALQMGVLFRF